MDNGSGRCKADDWSDEGALPLVEHPNRVYYILSDSENEENLIKFMFGEVPF